MATIEEGGVSNEEATELGDYSPGGCVSSGVCDPESDPSPTPAEPEPGPVYLTATDPNTASAVTVALPFGISVRVSHTARGVTIAESESCFPTAVRTTSKSDTSSQQ